MGRVPRAQRRVLPAPAPVASSARSRCRAPRAGDGVPGGRSACCSPLGARASPPQPSAADVVVSEACPVARPSPGVHDRGPLRGRHVPRRRVRGAHEAVGRIGHPRARRKHWLTTASLIVSPYGAAHGREEPGHTKRFRGGQSGQCPHHSVSPGEPIHPLPHGLTAAGS